MLLRLAVRNHLSVYEEQELSLVASKLTGAGRSLVFSIGGEVNVLPAALIYGTNASGKTNLIKALDFVRSAVLFSHTRGQAGGGVPRRAFALNERGQHEPTAIEVDFVIKGTRYQFGFEANDDAFVAEWLFAYPEGKRRRVYERDGGDVVFGATFRGQKKILVDLMRPNSLFISTATQNDHEYLGSIVKFFRRISYNGTITVPDTAINSAFEKREIDPRAIEFLSRSGTGVDGYRKSKALDTSLSVAFKKDVIDVFAKHYADQVDTSKIDFEQETTEIQLRHSSVDPDGTFLELDRESAGTRRILFLMGRILTAIDRGGLVVIDEIDASLHTRAAEELIGLFCNPDINRSGAQLIATIHDTNLLSSELMRRDQLWFCKKDRLGASSIYSLAEISSRPTDDFERGYLQGRYGALPNFPSGSSEGEQVISIDWGKLQ